MHSLMIPSNMTTNCHGIIHQGMCQLGRMGSMLTRNKTDSMTFCSTFWTHIFASHQMARPTGSKCTPIGVWWKQSGSAQGSKGPRGVSNFLGQLVSRAGIKQKSLARLRQFSLFLIAWSGKLGHKTACPNVLELQNSMWKVKKSEYVNGL